MSWNLTLLAIHILAAYACASVYCSAPGWMQKLVLGLLIVSSLVLVSVFACELFNEDYPWQVKHIAFKIEHSAVLLYLFRIVFIERLSCRRLSPRSQQYQA